MEFAGSSSLGSQQDISRLALPPLIVNPVSPLLIAPVGQSAASSIVFIDAGVSNYQSLIAAVPPDTEVRLLDATQAIAQITQTLLGRTGITSVQIISHGAAGSLHLGQNWLTVEGLDREADQIATWATALTADADILLLGCNVGQGALGQAFIQRLSQLSGADVAASSNLTGNAEQGGDWILEVNTGEIGATIAISAAALANYQGILADVDLISRVPNGAGNNLVSDAVGVTPSGTNISGNGRYVVFSSKADNLTLQDANGREDVFVYDRTLNATTLVSRATTGVSGNGDSGNAVISNDGNYVAFSSTASNLVAAGVDINGARDVFVWARATGAITLVSQGVNGVGNRSSDNPVITNNGSRIAFTSEADNLTTVTDNNGVQDVFIRDWQGPTPTTQVVSRAKFAGALGNKASANVSISGDGQYVAFSSDATNLIAADFNDVRDVFVRGLASLDPTNPNPFEGDVFLISRNDDGGFGDGTSGNAVISNDGTFVAFVSSASNLLEGNLTQAGLTDTNSAPDVFVRDWFNGKTVLVSINQAKTATGNSVIVAGGIGDGTIGSGSPVISFDGKYVAFASYSSDLVATDDNKAQDVFVRDWKTAAAITTLVSRANFPATGSANGSSFAPVISSDGAYVAFVSDASNVSPSGDTNKVRDVVLWQRSDDSTQIVSRNTAGNLGDAASYNPVLATDATGAYVGFISDGGNFQDPQDFNGQPDLFLRNVSANTTTLISKRDATLPVPATGIGNSNSSAGNSVSADGRYVVFTSTVANLINNDTNGVVQDVFWRDRDNNITQLVSRSQDGLGSGNQSSFTPIISSDGRYVAFTSVATNLVTGDTNGKQDVFVWDSTDNSMILVSRTSTGNGGNDDSLNPVMSSDGRYIAFATLASNLTTADTNNAQDILIWDRTINAVALVSRDASGAVGNGQSLSPTISNDGSVVAFVSEATNLVAADNNTVSDVFAWQLGTSITTGTVKLVSRSTAGTIGNGASSAAMVSGDGKFIAFVSTATNFAIADTNGKQDVFVNELLTGKTDLVSLNAAGTASGSTVGTREGLGSFNPVINNNGQYIAYVSDAIDLVANDNNGVKDVYAWNRATGKNLLVSVNKDGTNSGESSSAGFFSTSAGSANPVISADGLLVGFTSYSNDLVANDVNGQQDVFVRSLAKTNATLVSRSQAGSPSNNASGTPVLSSDGNYLVFTSSSSNLVTGDFNSSPDVFGDIVAVVLPTVTLGTFLTSVLEGNDPTTTPYNFEVILSKASTDAVTVPFTLTDITTTAGEDYVVPTATIVTFTPGQTRQTIAVVIKGDTKPEIDETFTLTLGTPSNAKLGAIVTATGKIINDDLPVISFSAATISGPETNTGKSDFNFVVTLSQPSPQAVTVGYSTADGNSATLSNNASAAAGDYDAIAAGTLTFAPNSTMQTITVKVNGDTKFEADESFLLTLANPTNATLSPTATATGRIINDDAAPTLSIADVSLNEGNTGTTDFPFVVTLSQAIDQNVVVNYATADGTATVANNDYVSNPGTLTILAGTTASTVIVKVNGDTISEPDETFTVQLSAATAGATPLIFTKASAIGTIRNDDLPVVGFSAPTVSIVEGNSGQKDLSFVLTLSQATNQPVTVNYTTTDGAAAIASNNAKVADSDYVAANGTVTFLPSSTIQTITVKVNGDTKFEPDQSFTLALSAPTNAALGTTTTATGTIINDDSPPTVSIADVSLNEGDVGTTDFPFVVTLSQAIDQDVVVNYATADGSATVINSDYISATDKLTIAAGNTASTVIVKVNGDTTSEPDETFAVQLSNALVGTTPLILTKATATGTIINDEIAINFSAPSFNISEGNSGTKDLNFIVTLSQLSSKPVTVNYATADGAAAIASNNARLADNDYTATTGTLTFASGVTIQTVAVKVNGDTKFEPDQSFTLTLSAPTNAALGVTPTATGTITNDDAAPTVSIADGQVIEGNIGTTDLPFVVTLSQAIDQDVVVNYATVDGSGTAAATDYNKTTSMLTIAAGATISTAIVKVTGDTLPETNETFTTQLTSATIGATALTFTKATATGTILNDDTVVSWSQPTFSIAEGNSGSRDLNFIATLSQPSARAVIVNYNTADGTSATASNNARAADNDYDSVVNGSITFAPNTTSQTIAIKVNGDTKVEANESFSLTLATPTNATLGTLTTATGTITNDDALIVPVITIAPSVLSQPEGNVGNNAYDFTVRLSEAIDQPITVVYNTSDGTAKAGQDYIAIANRTLTFAAGEISKVISVDIIGDNVYELDETFRVTLSNPTGATLGSLSASGSIANDDGIPFLLLNGVSQAEGNLGNTGFDFDFSLSNASDQAITVNYTTVDGTAKASEDYQATSGTLTFAAGTTTQKVTVNVFGDTQFEPDETFSLRISNPSNNVFLTNTSAIATITNDDGSPTLNFGQAAVTQLEGNSGTTDFLFTVVLIPANAAQSVTVNYATVDGTALVANGDYQAASGVLTFGLGETVKTIAVKVNGDTQVEPNETFSIALSGATNAVLGSTISAVGTITNDDTAPEPTVTIAALSRAEGNTGTTDFPFVVTLSQASTQTLIYNYNTVDGTATAGLDYLATVGSTTFTPGQTSQTITVKVLGDTAPEPDETFTFKLTKPNDPFSTFNVNAIGTILNDDGPSVQPTISISPISADKAEGNSGTTDFTFTVALSQVSSQPITVVYSTANGTANNLDYQAIPNTTLTFAAGEISKAIAVKVNGDAQFEPDETFTVNLASPTNATIATNNATGTIRNDDAPPNLPTVSISPLSANKAEGNSGTTDFTFVVNLSQSSSQPVTVNYSTADGTARIGDFDYQATNNILTFVAGQTSQTIAVKVTGDTQIESDETFTVNLAGATGATIATATAAGIIVNDDANFGGGGATVNSRNQDIIWRNNRTGENAIWLMNNTGVSSTASILTVSDLNWTIVDNVDINRDGNLDIVWRNYQTGENGVWFLQNSTYIASASFTTVTDVNWRIESVTDFNNDGNYDFLWRNNRTGENAIWLMNGTAIASVIHLPTLADISWTIAGVGDFNSDTNSDILLRNYRTGENAIWTLNGGKFVKGDYLPPLLDLGWTAIATADFNSDRSADILWRNYGSGENAIWYISNNSLITGIYLPTINDANVVPESVADFNSDRNPDIIWRNYRTGENFIWYLGGGAFGTSVSLTPVADRSWVLEKTGDYNADRNPDLLWRNTRTGEVANWFLNGTTVGQTLLLRPEPGIRTAIVASSDFDGDGYTDLILRDSITGKNTLWLMRDTNYLSAITLPDVLDLNTTVVGTADFNGNGSIDLLWNNNRTGETFIWQMNGPNFGNRIDLPRPKELDAVVGGIGDFNGDNNVDILWQSLRTGETFLWLMNGVNLASVLSYGFSGDVKWTIAGVADFDNDQNPDILWRNYRTGETAIWIMKGTTLNRVSMLPTVPDVDWTIAGVGELNGDITPDLLWRNIRTGDTAVWYMKGSTLGVGIYEYKVADFDWQIQGLNEFNRARG